MSGEIAASGEADMDEGWEQHIGPFWYRIVVGLRFWWGQGPLARCCHLEEAWQLLCASWSPRLLAGPAALSAASAWGSIIL